MYKMIGPLGTPESTPIQMHDMPYYKDSSHRPSRSTRSTSATYNKKEIDPRDREEHIRRMSSYQSNESRSDDISYYAIGYENLPHNPIQQSSKNHGPPEGMNRSNSFGGMTNSQFTHSRNISHQLQLPVQQHNIDAPGSLYEPGRLLPPQFQPIYDFGSQLNVSMCSPMQQQRAISPFLAQSRSPIPPRAVSPAYRYFPNPRPPIPVTKRPRSVTPPRLPTPVLGPPPLVSSPPGGWAWGENGTKVLGKLPSESPAQSNLNTPIMESPIIGEKQSKSALQHPRPLYNKILPMPTLKTQARTVLRSRSPIPLTRAVSQPHFGDTAFAGKSPQRRVDGSPRPVSPLKPDSSPQWPQETPGAQAVTVTRSSSNQSHLQSTRMDATPDVSERIDKQQSETITRLIESLSSAVQSILKNAEDLKGRPPPSQPSTVRLVTPHQNTTPMELSENMQRIEESSGSGSKNSRNRSHSRPTISHSRKQETTVKAAAHWENGLRSAAIRKTSRSSSKTKSNLASNFKEAVEALPRKKRSEMMKSMSSTAIPFTAKKKDVIQNPMSGDTTVSINGEDSEEFTVTTDIPSSHPSSMTDTSNVPLEERVERTLKEIRSQFPSNATGDDGNYVHVVRDNGRSNVSHESTSQRIDREQGLGLGENGRSQYCETSNGGRGKRPDFKTPMPAIPEPHDKNESSQNSKLEQSAPDSQREEMRVRSEMRQSSESNVARGRAPRSKEVSKSKENTHVPKVKSMGRHMEKNGSAPNDRKAAPHCRKHIPPENESNYHHAPTRQHIRPKAPGPKKMNKEKLILPTHPSTVNYSVTEVSDIPSRSSVQSPHSEGVGTMSQNRNNAEAPPGVMVLNQRRDLEISETTPLSSPPPLSPQASVQNPSRSLPTQISLPNNPPISHRYSPPFSPQLSVPNPSRPVSNLSTDAVPHISSTTLDNVNLSNSYPVSAPDIVMGMDLSGRAQLPEQERVVPVGKKMVQRNDRPYRPLSPHSHQDQYMDHRNDFSYHVRGQAQQRDLHHHSHKQLQRNNLFPHKHGQPQNDFNLQSDTSTPSLQSPMSEQRPTHCNHGNLRVQQSTLALQRRMAQQKLMEDGDSWKTLIQLTGAETLIQKEMKKVGKVDFSQPTSIRNFRQMLYICDESSLIRMDRNTKEILRSDIAAVHVAVDQKNGTVYCSDKFGYLWSDKNNPMIFSRVPIPNLCFTSGLFYKDRLYCSDTNSNVVWEFDDEHRKARQIAHGLNDPQGLNWSNNHLFVADTGNNRILKLAEPCHKSDPVVVAGHGGNPSQLKSPTDVSINDIGFLFVCDAGNGRILVWEPGHVKGYPLHLFVDQHPEFIEPRGVCLSDIWILVADYGYSDILQIKLADT